MLSTSSVLPSTAIPQVAARTAKLTVVERLVLAVGVIEIPLGVDKYLGYAEEHAKWGAVGGFPVSLTFFSLIFLYAIWAIKISRREIPDQKILFGFPQIVFLSTILLSVLAAQVRMLVWCELFLLLQAYALFFYVANRINTENDLSFLLFVLAGSLALQGLLMFGLKLLGESAFGQSYEFWMIKLDVWPDGRTAGTMRSAVLAGSWLAIIWLVVLPLFLIQNQSKPRLFLGACLAIGLIGLLFTQTRGAVLTVGLGCMLLGFAMWRRQWLPRWFLRGVGILSLVALVPLLNIVQKRILAGDDGSAESRKHLTLIALDTIAKNPVWGYGAGNCHLACAESANAPEFRSEWYYTIHCKYLLVWIECGALGLVAFTALLVNSIRQGVVTWFHRHRILSPIALGCVAAIAGHMLHMFVDIFNSRPQVQTLWMVLGIAACTYRQSLAIYLPKRRER